MSAIFISSYKSQQSIGNLNDYRLNVIATTAKLHWPYKEHLTLKKDHHQISTADLPANTHSNFIIMFNTQYVKYRIWILSL